MTHDIDDSLEPDGLRQAELFQARDVLHRLVGRRIADLRVEETRIALVTDDGATVYFYGFMGEERPEA
jgi:hypothetical protein